MGDKSPKSVQKRAGQKDAKAQQDKRKKKDIQDAKRTSPNPPKK